MIKQLLNSAIAKYRDLSVARRSIIDLLVTDKSRYFAQSRPIMFMPMAGRIHQKADRLRSLKRQQLQFPRTS